MVHCNLSACYKEMGDWQTASKEAARAIDAAPDFVKGHVRLGLATIDSQPQKAADAFQEALRLDPSNEAYEKYLGEARANLEKYEKAGLRTWVQSQQKRKATLLQKTLGSTDGRWSKAVLNWTPGGCRAQGRPLKRWTDGVSN